MGTERFISTCSRDVEEIAMYRTLDSIIIKKDSY